MLTLRYLWKKTGRNIIKKESETKKGGRRNPALESFL
jgi:hypothetical protein